MPQEGRRVVSGTEDELYQEEISNYEGCTGTSLKGYHCKKVDQRVSRPSPLSFGTSGQAIPTLICS